MRFAPRDWTCVPTGATCPNAGLASTWGGKGRATGDAVLEGLAKAHRRRSRSPCPGLQLKVATFGRRTTKKQQSGQLMGAHRGTCHGAPHRHHRAQNGPAKSWPWRHMLPCPERPPPRKQHLTQPTRSAAVSPHDGSAAASRHLSRTPDPMRL